MSEKEETDKGADTITEQQRELAQNALHDFNKLVKHYLLSTFILFTRNF